MRITETREALLAELSHIEAWEKDQGGKWIWEKIGRLPFMLLDRITPKTVQEKVGLILNEVGGFIQSGGNYLLSEKGIMEKLDRSREELGMLEPDSAPLTMESAASLPLAVMDKTADRLAVSHSNAATVQGATTGFGGLFTLAADIPAVLALSLKVIQEIAVCYGYNPKDKAERIFAVKCLQFASADTVGKEAVLKSLAQFTGDSGQIQAVSELQGWREVVASYRDNFGWKKLFQAVPVAGMVFGAFINRGTLQMVAESAKMLYRKRRIMVNAIMMAMPRNVMNSYMLLVGICPLPAQRVKKNARWAASPRDDVKNAILLHLRVWASGFLWLQFLPEAVIM